MNRTQRRGAHGVHWGQGWDSNPLAPRKSKDAVCRSATRLVSRLHYSALRLRWRPGSRRCSLSRHPALPLRLSPPRPRTIHARKIRNYETMSKRQSPLSTVPERRASHLRQARIVRRPPIIARYSAPVSRGAWTANPRFVPPLSAAADDAFDHRRPADPRRSDGCAAANHGPPLAGGRWRCRIL